MAKSTNMYSDCNDFLVMLFFQLNSLDKEYQEHQAYKPSGKNAKHSKLQVCDWTVPVILWQKNITRAWISKPDIMVRYQTKSGHNHMTNLPNQPLLVLRQGFAIWEESWHISDSVGGGGGVYLREWCLSLVLAASQAKLSSWRYHVMSWPHHDWHGWAMLGLQY